MDARMVELAREPAIVERAAALIGPKLHMFGSKFFPMLPQGGTSTGWHQDNHYFGTNSDRVVSCGIYLDAADAGNGCLRLLPRSHASSERRLSCPVAASAAPTAACSRGSGPS